MKNKFYIVTDIETHEKSDQIEWEILNCLGIWGCLLYTSPSPRD